MELVIALSAALVVGVVGGGMGVFFYLVWRREQLKQEGERQAIKEKELAGREGALLEGKRRLSESATDYVRRVAELELREEAFEKRHVSYEVLRKENESCKRDLLNIEMGVRKAAMDVAQTRSRQEELDRRSRELASRYLKENVKIIGNSVNARNFTTSRQRLLDVIGRCREIGFEVSFAEESGLLEELKAAFEQEVRAELEREEQARIRAQMREEQRLQRELDREIEQAEREKAAVQAALDRALAEAKDVHSAEVEQLQGRLAEAVARSARAVSQAQLTRAGNVYVISNIGTFGEGVFKVGMTRRLEPQERVKELGDASVPFPFDVHMMISSMDAPALENALHRALHKTRLNKVNPRKEFFRAELEKIRKVVEAHHGVVEYVVDAAALEYRQSLTMSEADAEYIEEVYAAQEEVVEEGGAG